MQEEEKKNHFEADLQHLLSLEALPKDKFFLEILEIFVPLALALPALRQDPSMMFTIVKAKSEFSGIEDVATKADFFMQTNLKERIIDLHPDWQFWGEEGEDAERKIDQSKSFLFITDPIEGTNNFRSGRDDHWGSVVALVDIKTQEPLIGIVGHPAKRKFYAGIKGKGAFILMYSENGRLIDVSAMGDIPEKVSFTYNNSPHFDQKRLWQVEKFLTFGRVSPPSPVASELDRSRKVVVMKRNDGNEVIWEDPESGALEAVRNRGTIYFKTGPEMAAVWAIYNEMGWVITDGYGRDWHMGIDTMIAARNQEDYAYLSSIFNRTLGESENS